MLDPAVRQDDVVRRDVAMQDPVLVRRRETQRHPFEQPSYLVNRQGFGLEDMGERRPVDELHDEIKPTPFVAEQTLVTYDGVAPQSAKPARLLLEEGDKIGLLAELGKDDLDGMFGPE